MNLFNSLLALSACFLLTQSWNGTVSAEEVSVVARDVRLNGSNTMKEGASGEYSALKRYIEEKQKYERQLKEYRSQVQEFEQRNRTYQQEKRGNELLRELYKLSVGSN